MSDFSREIESFQRYGIYNYKFDNVGNLIFDSSSMDFSKVYLALSIQNIVYDNSKLENFYDPEFKEFVPILEPPLDDNSSQEKLNILEEENISLKTKLDSILNTSNTTENDAEKMATKQVILELRISLKQGRVESDFSNDFPYSPIKKNT